MADTEDHSTKHIIQSLLVNVTIAAIKAVAAVLTKSGSMLAEAIHSSADCGNQVLLLIGVKSARRKPDATHPLGYGRDVYFWSFIVALLLFTGGGVFSVYEGIHKILAPEPVERVGLGATILGISLVLEGYATLSNVKEMNQRRKERGFFQYLRETKDSDLVVIFGENAAAVLGLAVALAALLLAGKTKDGRWDGGGSLVIGIVLCAVAVFLGREIKSLLLGESADPEIEAAVRAIGDDHADIDRVLHVVTVQQGPGEVMVAVKVSFKEKLPVDDVCRSINDFEAKLRKARPEIRWLFVEPDIDQLRPVPPP
ncbi:MAG: cation diffusion facilitator family transporter [Myxococcales bacterium]|nr:cation diffusion facilitator family transporter [Myxococcales bacterium]